MLSKYELEEIIKAWPDKDGVSSNPEVYNKWITITRSFLEPLPYYKGYN